MSSHKRKPLFISFEGVDGAGKSTQVKLLKTALENLGNTVCITREPGGDRVGETVRSLLLHEEMYLHTELLLFLAARAQNTEMVIRPALVRGEFVISDRYIDSSVAYQGYARGLDPSVVEAMNRFATNSLLPDITILLDVDPEIGLNRQQARNRMEEEGIQFLAKAREGFLAIASKYPSRIRIINALNQPESVHEEIFALISGYIKEQKEFN